MAKTNRENWDKLMFGGNREKAIIRDGEVCTRCGMTREEHFKRFGRDITVDHRDRKGKGVSYEDKNNSLDNLVTLCLPCHGNKDNLFKKLDATKAINIWHIGLETPSSVVAELYGITIKTVNDIRLCKRWKYYLNTPLRRIK